MGVSLVTHKLPYVAVQRKQSKANGVHGRMPSPPNTPLSVAGGITPPTRPAPGRCFEAYKEPSQPTYVFYTVYGLIIDE